MAQERGWIGLDESDSQFRWLNRLGAWLFPARNLDPSNTHPRFMIRGEEKRDVLDDTLDRLGIEYSVRGEQPPEIHPGADGAVLGHILSLLGAPVGESQDRLLLHLPVYLETVSPDIRRDFAVTSLLNRRLRRAPPATGLVICHPTFSATYMTALHRFLGAYIARE